jgi:hypothetical protein
MAIPYPDVAKAKNDLATYITAHYSVTWAIAKVVADYKLYRFTNSGNAWIDNIVDAYHSHQNRGDRHIHLF